MWIGFCDCVAVAYRGRLEGERDASIEPYEQARRERLNHKLKLDQP